MTPSSYQSPRRAEARRVRQRREVLDKASAALRSGDLRRAEMLARRLLEVDALDAPALDVVIGAMLARGDVASALFESERALLIAPRRAATLVTRARALLAANRPAEALDAARAAVDLTPDAASWQMLVVTTRATGDVLAAVEAAEEMTVRFPGHAGGPLLLAGLAEEMGAADDAREAYGRALALLPPDDPRHASIQARRRNLEAPAPPEPPAVLPPERPRSGGARSQERPASQQPTVDTSVGDVVPPPPLRSTRTAPPPAERVQPGHDGGTQPVADRREAEPVPRGAHDDDVVDLRPLVGEPQRRALRVAKWLDRLT